MRWFWIDRYLEFESGRYAVAIKNVSLAEEHLHDHFPGAPMMPNSLIVEGIAQTGGLLVGEYNQFGKRVVLAKVSRAKFHFPAVPGDTLTYRTQIEEIQARRRDGHRHQSRRRAAAGRGRNVLCAPQRRKAAKATCFTPRCCSPGSACSACSRSATPATARRSKSRPRWPRMIPPIPKSSPAFETAKKGDWLRAKEVASARIYA